MVVVALSGAVFDVHYHSAHAKKLVCSATGVYAPKCHQNEARETEEDDNTEGALV